jgi:hypothetical protein
MPVVESIARIVPAAITRTAAAITIFVVLSVGFQHHLDIRTPPVTMRPNPIHVPATLPSTDARLPIRR